MRPNPITLISLSLKTNCEKHSRSLTIPRNVKALGCRHARGRGWQDPAVVHGSLSAGQDTIWRAPDGQSVPKLGSHSGRARWNSCWHLRSGDMHLTGCYKCYVSTLFSFAFISHLTVPFLQGGSVEVMGHKQAGGRWALLPLAWSGNWKSWHTPSLLWPLGGCKLFSGPCAAPSTMIQGLLSLLAQLEYRDLWIKLGWGALK